jgi:phosphonate transport system substrate-binding protein
MLLTAYQGKKKELYMIGKILHKGVIIIVFLCLLVMARYADGAKKHITIAILPCADIMMTFKKFNPLAAYLETKTGLAIKLFVPKDYSEFESTLKNNEIDFVFLDPHTYVKLDNFFRKDAIISSLTRDGGTAQYGVVIVSKNSSIKTIGDLKGKTVMFGSKLSASRWLAARLLFEENRINIDKDLKSHSNGGCCEDIAFNVYLKAFDAGVVCDHFLDEHSEKQQELGINAKQLNIIGKTKAVPTRVFVARKGISNDIVTRIDSGLLSLDRTNPEHAKILYPAELGGFQRTKDEEYDSLRELKGTKYLE